MKDLKRAKRKMKDDELSDMIESFFMFGVALDVLRDVAQVDERELAIARTTQTATLSDLLSVYEAKHPGQSRYVLSHCARKLKIREVKEDESDEDQESAT